MKDNRAIAPDTAFDLASLTKQFTAMAILQLAERQNSNEEWVLVVSKKERTLFTDF